MITYLYWFVVIAIAIAVLGVFVKRYSIEPTPAIVEASKKLVQRLDYTGLGCAQFLVDKASNPKCFLEINPRLGAAFALPHACGIDTCRRAIAGPCVSR